MNLEKLKKNIQSKVNAHRQELIELSLKIHANPELGYEEVKAAAWITEYLEKNDFTVERGICDLPTAFRASYGRGKPVIAMLAEYDALPEVGHGCGHNIIGVASAGAVLASKIIADEVGGTVQVIGTPAEENLGGKVIMVEKGAFDGVDTAMMIHPRGRTNTLGTHNTTMATLEAEFWGKAAHAAAFPWDGISALDTLVLAINNVNALRFRMKDKSRVAGYITDGGKAANVVPEHAAATFMVRTPENETLDELCEKVLDCFKGAAVATGARLEYRWGLKVFNMRQNSVLLQLWADNMKALVLRVDDIVDSGGSIDMGNVSLVTPGIHPYIAISPEVLPAHSHEWAAVSASDAGMEALITGAKAMAMTAADIMTQPDTLSRIKKEFQNPK
ncbi:M20 family metallopeptidase [Chloroflexota bacterium]